MIPALRARRCGLAAAAPLLPASPGDVVALAVPNRQPSTARELAVVHDRARPALPELAVGELQLLAARLVWISGDEAAAAELFARAERSFVRAGAPISVAAVGLERAALVARAGAGVAGESLAEIARRLEIRALTTDIPAGLRAALELLAWEVGTGRPSPDLVDALAEYGHFVRTGTKAPVLPHPDERALPLPLRLRNLGRTLLPLPIDPEPGEKT